MIERTDLSDRIQTYTGKKFNYVNPSPDDVDVIDIAHSLSNQCRFTGHTVRFYSIAEHSVIVSLLVPKELALAALFHDASEAYLTDLATPIKKLIPEYREYESKIMKVIAEKVGFPYPYSEEIKIADVVQLRAEAQCLFETAEWADELPYQDQFGRVPQCLVPPAAEAIFILRYEELTGVQLFPDLVLNEFELQEGALVH